MALFTQGNQKVDIGNLSYGVSKKGMETYLTNLKAELLTDSKKKLEDVKAIQAAVDAGWQGIARDKFFVDFEQAINNIIKHLESEYGDLQSRLVEMANSYYSQDTNMYVE